MLHNLERVQNDIGQENKNRHSIKDGTQKEPKERHQNLFEKPKQHYWKIKVQKE